MRLTVSDRSRIGRLSDDQQVSKRALSSRGGGFEALAVTADHGGLRIATEAPESGSALDPEISPAEWYICCRLKNLMQNSTYRSPIGVYLDADDRQQKVTFSLYVSAMLPPPLSIADRPYSH